MLASDRRIPKRDEVLEILRSTPDNEARKRKIRDLDGGQTWQQIIRELFPPLRNARMVIVYQRPKTTASAPKPHSRPRFSASRNSRSRPRAFPPPPKEAAAAESG